MNKLTMEKEKRQIDDASPGTSKQIDETGTSTAETQNLRRSSRKREITTDHLPSKETLTKKRRPNSSAQEVIEELKICIQKNDSSVLQMKSIDDLPPEMLQQQVLQNVASSDLLNCRQMNQKCCEISSRIMRQRADIELRFRFHQGRFMLNIRKKDVKKGILTVRQPYYKCSSKSLTDLEICLNESKSFPYTSFHFDNLHEFANDDMVTFLSIWGKNILALNVSL